MKTDRADTAPIRLGILGAGLAVKQIHWPAIQKLADQYTIAQICDVDPAAPALDVAGDVPRTTNARALFDNAQVEAVLIALPIHLNAEMILAAARAGKAVLCEKPLAASLPQARRLVAALAGTPGVVAIAENCHFRGDVQQARAWIAGGRIGMPFLVQSTDLSWIAPDHGYGSTPWRQDPQYRGAVLTDSAVHHAAALRELGGEVEQLQAFVKDVHPGMGGVDTMVLNLRFRHGMLGSLVFSGATKAGAGDAPEFRVCGTEGTITIREGTAQLLRGSSTDLNTPEVVETFEAPEDERSGHVEEFRDFYASVRTPRPPRVPPAEALRDLEIVLGALDSAESRSVILLP